jgi:UDP-N-acetylmuramate--alanine ligase
MVAGEAPITIVDDYGHHPAEIVATLHGASEAWPHRRLVAVFQPHRYSRVSALMTDFARSFNDAAHVVVCPIYRAGEAPIEGVHHHRVAEALGDHGHRSVVAVENLVEAAEHLAMVAQPGDVIITLGAGDVNRVCGMLAERLHAGD